MLSRKINSKLAEECNCRQKPSIRLQIPLSLLSRRINLKLAAKRNCKQRSSIQLQILLSLLNRRIIPKLTEKHKCRQKLSIRLQISLLQLSKDSFLPHLKLENKQTTLKTSNLHYLQVFNNPTTCQDGKIPLKATKVPLKTSSMQPLIKATKPTSNPPSISYQRIFASASQVRNQSKFS